MLYKQQFVIKNKSFILKLPFFNYTITKMYETYILIVYANTNHEIVCL